jgi:hypothetical protein
MAERSAELNDALAKEPLAAVGGLETREIS